MLPDNFLASYQPLEGLRANFVCNNLGEFTDSHGSSRGISNSLDFELLVHLRKICDVAITGHRTAAIEGYKSSSRCAIAIIARSSAINDVPALTDTGSGRVILLTSAASEHPIDQLASNVEKIDLGQGSLRETVIHGLRRLSGLGLDRQLLEAGPAILGAASELIDELCLTVTDVDSEFDAEAAGRLRRQLPFLSQNMQLHALEIIGDTAFTRWR